MMYCGFSNFLYVTLIIQVSFFDLMRVTRGSTLKPSYHSSKLHQKLEAEEELVESLAYDICWDLKFYSNMTSSFMHDDCQNNFIKSQIDKAVVPPRVHLMCQFESYVAFGMDRLQNNDAWTLIVITPRDATTISNLPYDLVEKSHKQSYLQINPGLYTSWTTLLSSDGTHGPWQRGPEVRSWNLTGEVQRRTYNIQVEMEHAIVNGSSTVEAVVTWMPFDDEDICFHFLNHCNGKTHEIRIWPTESSNGDITRTISGLPLNSSCELRLSGRHGVTRHNYRTPSCNDLEDCIVYEMAQNMTVFAEPGEAGPGWDVHARWQHHQQPLLYNVTLIAENLAMSMELPGNVTEARFSGVEATGVYQVAIGAVLANRTVWTSGRAVFHAEGVGAGRAAGGAGGGRGAGGEGGAWAWGALPTAALLLALALLWRRRRAATLKRFYYPEPEDKPPKESECEPDLESSTSSDAWELRSERLLLHEVIGEGAFGVVRRGTLAPAGREVAVKMLKEFPTLDEVRSFRGEMELMKSVGAHPHIVSLVGCCSGRRPFIVAEYCSRGDLLSYLRCSWDVMVSKRNAKYYNNNIETADYRNDLFKCNSKIVVNKLYDLQGICDIDLTTRDLLSFCRQIAMGMEFLASNKLVHRDLAARNVLVSSDRTLKIADFGLSRDVYEENLYKQKGNSKMPMKWMALESLTRRIYTSQSDVWSFGVVMWEVASVGGSPYPGVPPARLPRLLRGGYRMPRPINCSKQLYEVMLSCWYAHPRSRPTFSELHEQLDELLNRACAQDYLSLELGADDTPLPKHKYVAMIFRDKLGFGSRDGYPRPLSVQSNHYSSPPAVVHPLRPPSLSVS